MYHEIEDIIVVSKSVCMCLVRVRKNKSIIPFRIAYAHVDEFDDAPTVT
jgi:hypothetical protein